LRAIQENFEEGYVKAKKRKRKKKKKVKWKENALSILRRAKEDTTNAKSQQKKIIKFHVFWCV
jgi:hypothetical protein